MGPGYEILRTVRGETLGLGFWWAKKSEKKKIKGVHTRKKVT